MDTAEISSPGSRMDLVLAGELQAALLPRLCPTDCEHQEAAARNRMCAALGGDFYDFIRINEDQTAMFVGDVAGHGVRAALVMARIMGFLRSRAHHPSRPADIIADLNEMLIELGDRINGIVSCSMLYGVIDHPTGTAFVVNAGHPPPILCEADRCRLLRDSTHDMLLGVEPFQPSPSCLTIRPGQRMVLYTDGITEARNEVGEMFGTKRLLETMVGLHAANPDECSEGVFRAVDDHRGGAVRADDETIVVIDRV